MNLAEIEMLSYRSESSVQYRNGWKTSGGSRTPGSRPSTALRLVQSTGPTLRTQIRTLIGAIPLLRHCVDEAHKYQERSSPTPEPIETFDFISSGRGWATIGSIALRSRHFSRFIPRDLHNLFNMWRSAGDACGRTGFQRLTSARTRFMDSEAFLNVLSQ